MASPDFTPVFMRNATAYGASPRQRFDIVLNNLCGFAHTVGEIRMTSDGSPWRPIVHVEDICEAMLCALSADREAVSGESFNVGADSENYRVREIADAKGVTASQLALAWVSAQGGRDGNPQIVPIPGTKRRRYLEENAGAADVTLSAEELEAIEKVAPAGVASGERYPAAAMRMLHH